MQPSTMRGPGRRQGRAVAGDGPPGACAVCAGSSLFDSVSMAVCGFVLCPQVALSTHTRRAHAQMDRVYLLPLHTHMLTPDPTEVPYRTAASHPTLRPLPGCQASWGCNFSN